MIVSSTFKALELNKSTTVAPVSLADSGNYYCKVKSDSKQVESSRKHMFVIGK